MKLQVAALYPGKIPAILGHADVKERKRRGDVWTQVLCDLTDGEHGSVAKPRVTVPDGTPRPVFKAQLELLQHEDTGRRVALVMPAEASTIADPEQRVLAPLYNNGQRIIFEFQRAEILIVTADGQVELRVVAVHPSTGAVGTQTKYTFHTRFAKLVDRCHVHLSGSTNLFPPQESAGPRSGDFCVPDGTANLKLTEDQP